MALAVLDLVGDEVFRYFLIGCNSMAIFVWILTLVTGNFSQMDRLWPILPVVYSWSFLYTATNLNPASRAALPPTNTNPLRTAILDGNESSLLRLRVMVALITIWGVRLAYGTYKRMMF